MTMIDLMVSVSGSSPTNLEYLSRRAVASRSIPLPIRNLTASTYSSEPVRSLSRSTRRASIISDLLPESILTRIMSRRTLRLLWSARDRRSIALIGSAPPMAASAASTKTNGGASIESSSV